MPNQTFLNLKPERQEEIRLLAMKEFTDHDFDSASLNRIIEGIGIAKGSFYRYFENKKELYLYLIDHALNKKLDYIQSSGNTVSEDFFELFKGFICRYISFDMKNPIYAAFLFNAIQNNSIRESDFGKLKKGRKFLGSIIENAQEKGQLRKDMDSDFIFFCIMQISLKLNKYIEQNTGFSYEKAFRGEVGLEVHGGELMRIFDQFIGFLQSGLSASTGLDVHPDLCTCNE